jgi:Protein kinase domain
MTPDPPPLSAGWRLHDRYVLERTLGRGGFGIAYLAQDDQLRERVVIKELAPSGCRRNRQGVIDLCAGPDTDGLMRRRFLDEAEVLRRFRNPGIPTLKETFVENGTAYFVTSYVADARTLDERIRTEGPLQEPLAFELLVSLLDIIEVVHNAGVLHRDIKPTNVLLNGRNEVTLIDFGAAREWIQDRSVTHTVMHTPGYAPPEQLSLRAIRTPASDLYALCATLYDAVTGSPPPGSGDRSAGAKLTPVLDQRPDLNPQFANAIERGLALRLSDRPQSVHELRELLRTAPVPTGEKTIEEWDDLFVRLSRFRYDKWACPACDGTLADPKPLRTGVCPVCQRGQVRLRKLDDRACPRCRAGFLTAMSNKEAPVICPNCAEGKLTWRRSGLLRGPKIAHCPRCAHDLTLNGTQLSVREEEDSVHAWVAKSGRSETVWFCSHCDTQLDELADGRRQMVIPRSSMRTLYPDEWARIAAKLPIDAGNAACDECLAEFWKEDSRMTILEANRDPFGIARDYRGLAIDAEDFRWISVGKTSGNPGLVCDNCRTEFDREGEYLRLVHSTQRRLRPFLDQPRLPEDWHRLGQDLPSLDEVPELEAEFGEILHEAYLSGKIAFDDKGAVWRGNASQDGNSSVLTITCREMSFGGLLKKWKAPTDALTEVQSIEDELALRFRGQPEPIRFVILPVELDVHLKSQTWTLSLTAEDLAEALRRRIS